MALCIVEHGMAIVDIYSLGRIVVGYNAGDVLLGLGLIASSKLVHSLTQSQKSLILILRKTLLVHVLTENHGVVMRAHYQILYYSALRAIIYLISL